MRKITTPKDNLVEKEPRTENASTGYTLKVCRRAPKKMAIETHNINISLTNKLAHMRIKDTRTLLYLRSRYICFHFEKLVQREGHQKPSYELSNLLHLLWGSEGLTISSSLETLVCDTCSNVMARFSNQIEDY